MLANDTDTDGGPKTIASATQPAHGTVAVTGADNLALTYTPNPGYCNSDPPASTDDFTYTLNGGSTATVAVTVSCAANPPSITYVSPGRRRDRRLPAVGWPTPSSTRRWTSPPPRPPSR